MLAKNRFTVASHTLQDVLLEPAGVTVDENGNSQLLLCSQCHSALKRDKIPPLSLANGTFLGPIPDELQKT